MNHIARHFVTRPATGALHAVALLLLLNFSARAALPVGWGDANIGTPAYTGSGDQANGLWTLRGGGADIWNNADQFYFYTNSLSGDGSIVARVLSQTGTENYAQAGVMMRDSASAGSPEASVVVTHGNEVNFRYRLTSGGTTDGAFLGGISMPAWVRLARSGNSFSAAWSTDGVNWSAFGSAQTIAMNANALAGLCVTAHNNSLTNIVTMTNVLLSPPATAATVPADLANELVGQIDLAVAAVECRQQRAHTPDGLELVEHCKRQSRSFRAGHPVHGRRAGDERPRCGRLQIRGD